TPRIQGRGGRVHVNIIGAVSLLTGKVFTPIVKRFNARTFRRFRQKLLARNEGVKKIVLILDNARVHHAKIIQKSQSLVKHELELIFLPPYSPKLNPIEQPWTFTREWITHDKFHATFDTLLKDLRAFLAGLKVPNEEVKSRCCFY
ncbi:MAG: IS630 family transposase, partial [Candidatus Sigynarchaeota archaeon]